MLRSDLYGYSDGPNTSQDNQFLSFLPLFFFCGGEQIQRASGYFAVPIFSGEPKSGLVNITQL